MTIMEPDPTGPNLHHSTIKPSEPPRLYGPLELTTDADRERAKAALVELWHVSGLYENSRSDDVLLLATRLFAWQMLSSMLLGDELPDWERLT